MESLLEIAAFGPATIALAVFVLLVGWLAAGAVSARRGKNR